MEINLGRVQGLSAYEVAVKKGYEGTEEEWLSSLKGQKGETGERGIQGERGEQGKQGEKGKDFTYEDFTEEQLALLKGEKGDKGETGEQGLQGIQGEKGEKGDKGDKGEAFTYEDFTEEQLAGLKGEKGEKGDKGEPGLSGSYDDTEIKKQIEELEAENKRLKKDFEASMIEGQAEGEKITISDSVEARFKSFEIEGNSKQEIREGYNLFNANNTTFSNRNNTGNPIIHSDNKIDITIMGVWARINGMVNGLKPNTSYRISCNWKADTTITAGLWNGSNFSSEAIKKSNSADVYLIATSNENGELSFYFYCNYSGEALTNKKVEFDEIMVVEGTEKKEYEAYGVSPTTEYPSEIKAVKENIHVKIVDENNGKEQNYSIPVQQEMLANDSFIKVNGEWKEKHNWNKVIINGSETINYYDAPNKPIADLVETVYVSIVSNKILRSNKKNVFYSDKFLKIYQDTGEIWGKSSSTKLEEGMAIDTTSIRLRINKSKLIGYDNSLNDMEKADKVKTYLAENPILVYYGLEEPMYLDCTEQQRAILEEIEKTAYTYQDTTHIYSTDEVSPVFKVRYVKSIEKIMGNLATILDAINGEVVE